MPLWGPHGGGGFHGVSHTALMNSQPWLLELDTFLYCRFSKAGSNGCLFTFVILNGFFKTTIKVLVAVKQQGVCLTGRLVLSFGGREGACPPPCSDSW